nr:MAG TPA: hypothetical protein [Caudoviricetes sp.]
MGPTAIGPKRRRTAATVLQWCQILTPRLKIHKQCLIFMPFLV